MELKGKNDIKLKEFSIKIRNLKIKEFVTNYSSEERISDIVESNNNADRQENHKIYFLSLFFELTKYFFPRYHRNIEF